MTLKNDGDWRLGPEFPRFLGDLIAAEMAGMRPGSRPMRLSDDADLASNSLEHLRLALAVTTALRCAQPGPARPLAGNADFCAMGRGSPTHRRRLGRGPRLQNLGQRRRTVVRRGGFCGVGAGNRGAGRNFQRRETDCRPGSRPSHLRLSFHRASAEPPAPAGPRRPRPFGPVPCRPVATGRLRRRLPDLLASGGGSGRQLAGGRHRRDFGSALPSGHGSGLAQKWPVSAGRDLRLDGDRRHRLARRYGTSLSPASLLGKAG